MLTNLESLDLNSYSFLYHYLNPFFIIANKIFEVNNIERKKI